MLRALTTAPEMRKSAICSAICRATFSCASVVAAPRCGVAMRFSLPNSGLSLAGSVDEHVERRAGDMAGIERCLQIRLDDEAAAGAVDDADARLHLGDGGGVDDVARRVGQRRVQGDEVGAGEELVELDLLDAEATARSGERNGS